MPIGLIIFIVAVPLSILLVWYIDRTCAEAEFGKERKPKKSIPDTRFENVRAFIDIKRPTVPCIDLPEGFVIIGEPEQTEDPGELPDHIDAMLEAAGVKRKEKEHE